MNQPSRPHSTVMPPAPATPAASLDPVPGVVAAGLLRAATSATTLDDLVAGILDFVGQWIGCEAVALRLRDSYDFPFHSTRGFDEEFLEAENSLCRFDENGPVLDEQGQPVLECVCGHIITGDGDDLRLACTTAGSFVTQDVDQFLQVCPQDLPGKLRGRCVQRGYKSIAIIPLRHAGEVVGVLHLCDSSPHAFSQPVIDVLEDLSSNLALLIVQHRALAALRHVETSYDDLVETMDAIVIRMDREGRITLCNQFAEQFFGYDRSELIGRSPVGTIVPVTDEAGRHLDGLMRDLVRQPEHYRLNENENITKDGQRVWLMWHNRPVYDEQGRLRELLCVGTDVTRYRASEQGLLEQQSHLRALAAQLLIREERERRSIAEGVHEDAAQLLAFCKMRAGALRGCELEPEAAGLAAELDAALAEAVCRFRDLSFELSPSVLHQMGLAAAIGALAERTAREAGIEIGVSDHLGEASLSQEAEVLLFRAARELLGSLVRDSAGGATVDLSGTDGVVALEVCAAGADGALAGHDLDGLRRRIEPFGGRLVTSDQGASAACVTLRLPNHPAIVR